MNYGSIIHQFHWTSLFLFLKLSASTFDVVYDIVHLEQLYVPQEHVFVVHGTFAQEQDWYQWGGDFYTTFLAQSGPNVKVHPFRWSGRCSHLHRVMAARELASFIRLLCNPHDTITLIGHSHGGNVCIMAVNELVKHYPDYYIKTIFSLGTPISYDDDYLPDMQHIGRLYHLFSLGDLVQPVFNLYSRVFQPHERIWNIAVTIDGKLSNHSELRSPLIAYFLRNATVYSLENETTMLHLKSDGAMVFEHDDMRSELLELERESFNTMFSEALSRKLLIDESPH